MEELSSAWSSSLGEANARRLIAPKEIIMIIIVNFEMLSLKINQAATALTKGNMHRTTLAIVRGRNWIA